MELGPMDFVILEKLPPAGLIGGVHWRGRIAVDIAKEILAEIPEEDKQYVKINGLTVGNALTQLEKMGYVKKFTARGGNNGKFIWARTPLGTEILDRKSEYLGYQG